MITSNKAVTQVFSLELITKRLSKHGQYAKENTYYLISSLLDKDIGIVTPRKHEF